MMLNKGFSFYWIKSLLIIIALYSTSSASVSFASQKLKVFACEPEWKSLSESIGGDHVKVFSATTAFQDPHYVEARPSFIAKARTADLLVCTGADLEIGWLPLLIRKSGNPKINAGNAGHFMAAEAVDLIEIPTELDRSLGDIHAFGNPHFLWDPYRVLRIAEALTKRLVLLDSEHQKDYNTNFKAFEASWTVNIKRWEAATQSLRGSRVITGHKGWSYLLEWLAIESAADLEPKPGIPPTSAHLSTLLNLTREEHIDFILISDINNGKGAQWLKNKTQLPIVSLPYTVGGSDNTKDLSSLFDVVIQRLLKVHQENHQ